MQQPRFRHRIERTRNKHSRAICREDTIIIRLARNLSQAEEREHIQSLLRRMTQVLLQERRKQLISPFRHLLNGGSSQTVTLENGHSYTITLTPGTKTSVRRTREGWHVTVAPNVRRPQLHRLLWNLVAKAELPWLETLVRRLNERTYDETIRGVRCQFASTQWGSCSRHGVIMINAALLFVPRYLLDYVIIHEIAHRRIPNHSTRYWEWVAAALPEYRIAYDELHTYRLPSL